MPESQHCTEYLIEAFRQLWLFLVSNDGQFFFASIATVRAIIHYLDRSRIAPARDLAAAILVATILAVVIAASESRITKAMIQGLRCKHSGNTEKTVGTGHRGERIDI
jgi:hypothetical protein